MNTAHQVRRERRTEKDIRNMDIDDIVLRVHALEDTVEAQSAEIERLTKHLNMAEMDRFEQGQEIERLRELVVWHTSSPMLETMEALGASEDELAVVVANWFAARPCHYDETLQAALAKEDKP